MARPATGASRIRLAMSAWTSASNGIGTSESRKASGRDAGGGGPWSGGSTGARRRAASSTASLTEARPRPNGQGEIDREVLVAASHSPSLSAMRSEAIRMVKGSMPSGVVSSTFQPSSRAKESTAASASSPLAHGVCTTRYAVSTMARHPADSQAAHLPARLSVLRESLIPMFPRYAGVVFLKNMHMFFKNKINGSLGSGSYSV